MKTITQFLFLSLLAITPAAFSQPPGYYDNGSAMRAQVARDNARYAQQAANQRAEVARENARYAQQAANQRAEVARENARYAQHASDQRAQVARENARYAQHAADQRAQMARENARYGSSGYSGGYSSPAPRYSSPAPRYYGESQFVEGYVVDGHFVEGGFVQPQPRFAPQPQPEQQVAGRGRGQYFPLGSDITGVNGRRRPSGSRGYYFNNGQVVFDTELEEVEAVAVAPKNTAPAKPVVPTVVEPPKPSLPTARFDGLYPKFGNEPGAAHVAYLELIDEAIAPQAADAPVPVIPEINKDLEAEVKRDRLSSIKTMFDNGALPDIKTLMQNVVWVGRCAPRSSPKFETGAMLGFMVENQKLYAALVTAATPTQMVEGVDVGNPKKFDTLGPNFLNQIRVALGGVDREKGEVTHKPREDRPLSSDSLFFDGVGLSGAGTVGNRLRLFEGPTKKMIAVLETYSPYKDGVAFTDKRVEYLEPVQYCYFTRSAAY